MALCFKAFGQRFALTSVLCGGLLAGCVSRSISATDTVPTTSVLTGPQGLSLHLQDATGAPVQGAEVTWRPVFKAPAQALRAESDLEGRLNVTSLWPGVRYVIQVLTPSGERFQRVYTPSAYGQWQWRLTQPWSPETPSRAAVQRVALLSPETSLPEYAALLQHTAASLSVSTALTSSAIVDLTAESDTSLVWWMAHRSPQALAGCADRCVSALVDYVQAGGTLLVTGEWAGLGADPDLLTDRLGQALNFSVGRDTLAQPQNRLRIRNLQGHALTEGVQQMVLQRSSSVVPDALAQAQELAFASAEHYQILQASEETSLKPEATVLAVLQQGNGQVIVVGDSSLWSDAVLCDGDNLQLWHNILRGAEAAVGKSGASPCDNTLSSQGAAQETL